MARYVNQRGADTIPYVSMYDPQFDQNLLQVLNQRQQRYDAGRQAMNEYRTQVAGQEFNQYDRPHIDKRLGQDVQELQDLVKNQYNGDYGSAINKLSDEIINRKNYYLPAVQRYKEEQKIDPTLRQLEAQDQLIFPNQVDPRTQSVYDESGRYVGIPKYDFKVRTDYDKEIGQRFKAAGDKITEVVKGSKSMPGYYEAIKTKGLGALSQQDLDAIVSDKDVQNFISETTYGIDPKLKGKDAKSYILDKLNSIYTTQQDKQYIYDQYGEELRREAKKKSTDPGFAFPKFTGTVENPTAANELKSIKDRLDNATDDLKVVKRLAPITSSSDKQQAGVRAGMPGQPYTNDKISAGYRYDPRVGGGNADKQFMDSYNVKEEEDLVKLADKYQFMPGATKKEKILNGVRLEQAQTVRQYNTYDLNAADGGEAIRSKFNVGLLQSAGKKGVLKEIKDNGKIGSEYTGREAIEILNGNSADKVPPAMVSFSDKDGFVLSDAKGKRYKLEVDALDANTRPDVELLTKLQKEAFDYSASSIKEGNSKELTKRIGTNSQGDEFYIRTNPTEFNPQTNSFSPAKYIIQVRGGKPVGQVLLSSYDDVVNNRSSNTTGILNQLTEQTLQSAFPVLNYQNPGTSKTVSAY